MTKQTKMDENRNIINLGRGQPQPKLLPRELMQRAAQATLEHKDYSLLNYGPGAGDKAYLEALASYLSRGYGTAVQPDSLFTTNGASAALELICSVFTKPGDTIFVEEPSYFLALKIFADHELKIVGIPLTKDGIDLDTLDKLSRKHKPKLFYTIPVFQNPTGQIMSSETREALLGLAHTHNFLVIADEVYQMLDYTRSPPRPFASRLDTNRVLSVGSFSKILAPGLRVGWIQTSQKLRQRLVSRGVVASGGCLNQFTPCLLTEALNHGWAETYLTNLKSIYKARVAYMDSLLSEIATDHISYQKPHGGFFFWLKLSQQINTENALTRARQHGLSYQPGSKFGSNPSLNSSLRLSFTYYEETELQRGIESFANFLQSEEVF